jgi:maleate isomerase
MTMRAVERLSVSVELDDRPLRYRIGLVALSTDHTLEHDMDDICGGDEIGVYVTRVAFANPMTRENLVAMGPRLTEAAGLILPDEVLDAVAYGCTSASVAMGDEAVTAAIRAAKPDVPVTNPGAAACAALKALGVKRISVLTPYPSAVTAPFGDYFTGRGFDVASLCCLDIEDDREVARVSPATIAAAAREACADDAEALFISCTALRAAALASSLEEALGRPVVTSNQALIWHALRLAGCDKRVAGYGRLLL